MSDDNGVMRRMVVLMWVMGKSVVEMAMIIKMIKMIVLLLMRMIS